MNRLDRRLTILRGKRNSAFDTDQYYLEDATRARVARKVRSYLRRDTPVVLITPKWSLAPQFLDDLSVDLAVSEPKVTARPLSLAPLKGLDVPQAWAWLVQAVAEFIGQPLHAGPAWQAVSRRGFRHVMADLLQRSEDGERRCLLIHNIQHIDIEALNDLITVFEEHTQNTARRRFNLLLAGNLDGRHFGIRSGQRIELPDFSPSEAVEVLVEHHGPMARHRLLSAVEVVGGVPAVLEALAENGQEALTQVVAGTDEVWNLLDSLADEVRQAMNIVNCDNILQARLADLARCGSLPEVPEQDSKLMRAGLVRARGLGSRRHSEMRAPWFADLAAAF